MASGRKKSRLVRWPPLQFFVYGLVRSVAMIVVMFPYSSAPVLGRYIGWLVRWIDAKHRSLAAKNLERTRFTNDIPGMILRIYENIGRGIVEMLMLPRIVRNQKWKEHIQFHGLEILGQIQAQGRGVIVVIGHLGNWELAGLAINAMGYRLHSLARPIDNPYINRWILQGRTSTGNVIIPQVGALPEMIRVLKNRGILVIQVDQHAGGSGILVDFFGRPASTVRSPALLSLKYGSPIVPVEIYREEGMNFGRCSSPIYPGTFRDVSDPVRAITQEFTTRLEGFVRQHPEQWLWLHRRWKSADREWDKKILLDAPVL
jgi:KDO2-lipid IV(A) lauroyltransferase